MAKCQNGHKGCTCGMMCCQVTDERGAQIAADARSGRNWAEEKGDGPGCICGAGGRTNFAALALKAPLTSPSGMCARHRGGSVWASRPDTWKEIRGTQEDGVQA